MRKIYKYALDERCVDEPQTVMMPRGAHILDIQVHNGQIVLWAEVVPEAILSPREFYLAFTGSAAPRDVTGQVEWSHCKTVQLTRMMTLVYHVYRKRHLVEMVHRSGNHHI